MGWSRGVTQAGLSNVIQWHSRCKDDSSKQQQAVLVHVEQAVYTMAQQYTRWHSGTAVQSALLERTAAAVAAALLLYVRAHAHIHALPGTYVMVEKPRITCTIFYVNSQS